MTDATAARHTAALAMAQGGKLVLHRVLTKIAVAETESDMAALVPFPEILSMTAAVANKSDMAALVPSPVLRSMIAAVANESDTTEPFPAILWKTVAAANETVQVQRRVDQ